jgi:hypothetical protein
MRPRITNHLLRACSIASKSRKDVAGPRIGRDELTQGVAMPCRSPDVTNIARVREPAHDVRGQNAAVIAQDHQCE